MNSPLPAILFIALLLAACAAPVVAPKIAEPQSTGPMTWKNLHQGDPALAGVEVMQLPEGSAYESKTAYVTGHPAMILYYFWDGRVRQTEFEADGRVNGDFFWPKNLGVGWNHVDFAYGSDPSFLHHRDPRRPTPKPRSGS